MIKVLFILDNLEGGGAERVFVNIANGFVTNNISVEILLGKKTGIFLGILNPSIKILEVGSNNFFAYLKSFPAIFKKHSYTHIFTAGHYISAAAVIVKKRYGIHAKIYQTHHYSHPDKRPIKYWKGDLVLKALYYFTAPAADRIISVSHGSLQWLGTFSGRALPQGMVIHNPVFDNTIYNLAQEPVSFPTSIEGKTVLLNIGRLSEQKDQSTLVNAFNIYREKNTGALLFILGTGPLKKELKERIRGMGLEQHIFLVGFQQNPYKWLACCDLFILSSQYEGFGNVIVEAMALGKTVVSTNCPSGPSEIITDGITGYLCPTRDAEALAVAIEKGVNQPLDKEIVQQASRRFEAAVIVKKYIDLL